MIKGELYFTLTPHLTLLKISSQNRFISQPADRRTFFVQTKSQLAVVTQWRKEEKRRIPPHGGEKNPAHAQTTFRITQPGGECPGFLCGFGRFGLGHGASAPCVESALPAQSGGVGQSSRRANTRRSSMSRHADALRSLRRCRRDDRSGVEGFSLLGSVFPVLLHQYVVLGCRYPFSVQSPIHE